MDTLLATLRTYLTGQLVSDYLSMVEVSDPQSMGLFLNAASLPLMLIVPLGERHEPGAFSLTARMIYSVSLRIFARSADPLAYLVPPISGTNDNKTISAISDKVRKALYQDKHLGGEVFEMLPAFTITDTALDAETAGTIPARDIRVDYSKLEGYTGMANDQESLSLSVAQPVDPFEF
jgi:hypothetical protein